MSSNLVMTDNKHGTKELLIHPVGSFRHHIRLCSTNNSEEATNFHVTTVFVLRITYI